MLKDRHVFINAKLSSQCIHKPAERREKAGILEAEIPEREMLEERAREVDRPSSTWTMPLDARTTNNRVVTTAPSCALSANVYDYRELLTN